MSTPTSFGEWIKRARRQHNLTQKAVAQHLHCSVSALRKYESGERRPSPDSIKRLADILQILDAERDLFIHMASLPLQSMPNTRRAAPRPSHQRRQNTLPAPSTVFIGRGPQLSAIRVRMRPTATRLITLLGPPGIGKTRLAFEAAHMLASDFFDGAYAVELAPLHDPHLVAPAVLRALGEQPLLGQTPAAQLINRLHNQQVLLVLDNCEHLLDPSGVLHALVDNLLRHCPLLKIIATSRITLHIRAENVIPVEPFELPPPLDWHDPAAIAKTEAVQFLRDRVAALGMELAITPATAPLIAQICQRLDGLPLALELVAPHAATGDLAALLAQLEHALPLLADGPRDMPHRQRTLRSAIAWSYNLLSAAQQHSFALLGVFAGGFTPQAAQAVGIRDAGMLDELREKSLIQARGAAWSPPRHRLLETMREFAVEQLAQQNALAEAQARHAAWFAELAAHAKAQLNGAASAAWLGQLDDDLDNLRAAMCWSMAGDAGTSAARIASALFSYWRIRGRFGEACDWLQQALDRAGTGLDVPIHARALEVLGFLRSQRGDPRCIASFQHSMALYRSDDDQVGVGRMLAMLGMLARYSGNRAITLALLGEARDLLEEYGEQQDLHGVFNQLGLGWYMFGEYAAAERAHIDALACLPPDAARTRHNTMIDLADAYALQGQYARAHGIYQQVLAFAETTNDREMLAGALHGNGYSHVQAGNYDDAVADLQHSLAIYDEMHIVYGIANAETHLAIAEALRGNHAVADDHANHALPIVCDNIGVEQATHCLLVLAWTATQRCDAAQAARMLGTAAALHTCFTLNSYPFTTQIAAQATAAAHQQLGAECFAQHHAAAATIVRERIPNVCYRSAHEAIAAIQVRRVVEEALML